MSLINLDFNSKVLHRTTSLYAIIPEVLENLQTDRNYQVLYLLHGIGDNYTKWIQRTKVQQDVRHTKLVIISASYGTSFYSNMVHGDKYWDFLTQEIPKVTENLFPISKKREDHFVAGMSMGGFGAFKWALNQPERFGVAASFSGALDINEQWHALHDRNDPLHNFNPTGDNDFLINVMRNDFGQLPIKHSINDLFWTLKQKDPKKLPKLYQYCGADDPLLPQNLKFKKLAESITNLKYSFSSTPGGHEWDYWNKCIDNFIGLLPLKK